MANKWVTRLAISRNQLIDGDIFLIAEALYFNTVLKNVNVSENPFTSESLMALERVICNDRDSNVISSSDHYVCLHHGNKNNNIWK